MFSTTPVDKILDFANYHNNTSQSIPLTLSVFDLSSLTLAELSKFNSVIDEYNESGLDDIRLDDICNIIPAVGLLIEKKAQLVLLLNEKDTEIFGYYIIYKYPPVPKSSLVSVLTDPHIFEDTYYLFDIYINPKYRGIGLGKILVEHLIESYDTIHLHVREDNPAIYLYKSMGFVFIDRIIDYYDADNNALSLLYVNSNE